MSLFEGDYTLYFSLSILFISFSFVMVWSVSLRFIAKFINDKKRKQKQKSMFGKFSNEMNQCINFVIILYLFPPIGILCVTIYELYMLFYDCYLGLSSFMNGNILVIEKDSARLAFKQFRRIVEFHGETIVCIRFLLVLFLFCLI